LNINELARRLNLSISTVSAALNDAPDVSRETRERVKEVAAQYGYRANRLGRRLRRGKPETIGFLLTPPQRQFADPLYLEAIAGANEALNAYDLELSVTLARSQEDEIETLRRMVEAKAVDGFLLARTRRDDKRIEYLLEKGIAFASWGRSTGLAAVSLHRRRLRVQRTDSHPAADPARPSPGGPSGATPRLHVQSPAIQRLPRGSSRGRPVRRPSART
jgi:DNA-binding LacI/PurR family transcriptional regulator